MKQFTQDNNQICLTIGPIKAFISVHSRAPLFDQASQTDGTNMLELSLLANSRLKAINQQFSTRGVWSRSAIFFISKENLVKTFYLFLIYEFLMSHTRPLFRQRHSYHSKLMWKINLLVKGLGFELIEMSHH